ncbi:MAG: MJ1477/TM1410 family putative glycoside hydrolase [Hyphomicrobiaceae bacterium]|nr:hypothetical protein [Hyphomicrobiaceae bacterium]
MRIIVSILKFLILLAVAGGSIYAANQTQTPRPTLTERTGPAIVDAKTWGYQLQHARPEFIDQSVDVIVIDYARDGRDETAWRAADIEAFRQRPNNKPRIVLAYMSIGEAENYRFYWQPTWSHLLTAAATKPAWLADENSEWKGNFLVRYWHPDWQKIFVSPGRTLLDQALENVFPWRKPYIDRIIDAGFDGVYLDRVDAFQEWSKDRTSSENDMVAFTARLSRYAKARHPGFLVVPQNGEELLRRADYRRLIDGVAKEDLFFGVNGQGKENSGEEINRSILMLNRATADRLPVFVVEYLKDRARQAAISDRATKLGYIIHFADRELNRSPETVTLKGVSPPK